MKLEWTLYLLAVFVLFSKVVKGSASREYDYWSEIAKKEADNLRKLLLNLSWKSPRNIIVFLGDGMGISTVTGARLYSGQVKQDKKLGQRKLNMESFPITGFLRTLSDDSIVTDSAASATAYLTGVKALNHYVGFTSEFAEKSCDILNSSSIIGKSFLIEAKKKNYATGFLTTTRVTHATPSALYAQTINRQWESDRKIHSQPGVETNCVDIAKQLAEKAYLFNFIGGGGSMMFDPAKRLDNVDLIKKISDDHLARGNSFQYYNSIKETIDKNTDYAMMLINENNVEYNRENQNENLANLTKHAVDHLMRISKNNEKGFVLFIEGGRIDHGHHVNKARVALDEALAMDEVIGQTIMQLGTEAENTLFIVTADHSHGFTINIGSRNESMFDETPCKKCKPEKNIQKLGYFSGPGTGDESDEYYKSFKPFVQTDLGFHSGEDVPIYARGPLSQLFIGVHDNTYLAHTLNQIINSSRKLSHFSLISYILFILFISVFHF